MTVRVWTVEELDKVHQLPDGWAWGLSSRTGPFAVHIATFGEVHVISERPSLPAALEVPLDVTLAVILANMGLDSLGAMADAMKREAVDTRRFVASCEPCADLYIDAVRAAGNAEALERVAAMLERGTVNP